MNEQYIEIEPGCKYRIHSVWPELTDEDLVLTLDRNEDDHPNSVAEWHLSQSLGLEVTIMLDGLDEIIGQGYDDFVEVIEAAIAFCIVNLGHRRRPPQLTWERVY